MMMIAYTEKPGREFWHVAWVDGFFLAKDGDDILFRETRVVRRESVPTQDGHAYKMVDVIPPRVEVTDEFPVADWFRVDDDMDAGVYRREDLTPAQ